MVAKRPSLHVYGCQRWQPDSSRNSRHELHGDHRLAAKTWITLRRDQFAMVRQDYPPRWRAEGRANGSRSAHRDDRGSITHLPGADRAGLYRRATQKARWCGATLTCAPSMAGVAAALIGLHPVRRTVTPSLDANITAEGIAAHCSPRTSAASNSPQ
jgi:hypothetical protein